MAIWNRHSSRLKAPPPPARPADDSGARPEFLTQPPQMRALLGRDSEVSGKLSFAGPTRIDGTLRGEVRATDLLVIGETGYVNGTVRAGNLVVLGRVEGDVLDAERVEIGSRGVLSGTVETRALVVRDGGTLDGDCRVSAPRAKLTVLRPRTESEASSAE
ncbi:MAG: bactofilin family protein [Candidatus Binatia bacterium]